MRLILLLVLCVGHAIGLPASAQERAAWKPSKPVEIWVTFGKGAHADIWAHEIIALIEKHRLAPVPFRVVNMPKGIGAEAFPKFAQRTGDDHTLMLVLPNVYTVPLYNNVAFDLGTMTPIAGMGYEPLALWVKSSRKDIRNLNDLLKVATASGRSFKVVGPPVGTPRAMLAQMIIKLYDLDVTYVGIKRIGNTAKVLAEQDFDVGIYNPVEQTKLADPGANRPIVFFSGSRNPRYLQLPTFRETGMEITYRPGRVVIGPPGMSAGARDFYANMMKRVYDSPEWQATREAKQHAGDFLSGEKLSEFLAYRIEKHKRWKMTIETY